MATFSAGLPPPACHALPPATSVAASIEPIAVGTQFDLAQLRELGKQTKRIGKHAPYGFYTESVTYLITVEIGNDAQDPCKGPVNVRVSLRLVNRHIEVAQDLKNDTCFFPKVVTHYQHHAKANEAVFQRYIPEVTAALARAPVAAFARAYRADNPVKSIAGVAADLIKPVLDAMDAERESARDEVDTPSEMQELEGNCPGHA